MQERRMVQEQLIALKAANYELELLEINAQFMTPEVLAYKWIQTANNFAEKGLPFCHHRRNATTCYQQVNRYEY